MWINRKIAGVVVACTVGSVVTGTHWVRADDMGMKDPMMAKDKMADDSMGDMKKMMMDPSMAPSADDMAKAKAMQEIVKTMSEDPAMKDMAMKMKDDMKAPSEDDVKKAKEALMKDPAAMKLMMAHAMTMAMHPMGEPSMSNHGMPAMKQ